MSVPLDVSKILMRVPFSEAVASRVPVRFKARHPRGPSWAENFKGDLSIWERSTKSIFPGSMLGKATIELLLFGHRTQRPADPERGNNNQRWSKNKAWASKLTFWVGTGVKGIQQLRHLGECVHLYTGFQNDDNPISAQFHRHDRARELQLYYVLLLEIIPHDHCKSRKELESKIMITFQVVTCIWRIHRSGSTTDQSEIIAAKKHLYIANTSSVEV